MNPLLQAVIGAGLFLIGSIKTYLHVSAESVVAFPTCGGGTVLISMGDGNLFQQAHCWGCYVALAGAAIMAFGLFQSLRQKRAFALELD